MRTEKQLHAIADRVAETIVERRMVNGNSCDIRRMSTTNERTILSRILFSGIYAVEKCGANLQSVADTCEMVGHGFLPDINCYDSIYVPLKKYVKSNDEGSN